MANEKPDKRFTDFKDVVSELAIHAWNFLRVDHCKVSLFQVKILHTAGKKAEMIDVHQN